MATLMKNPPGRPFIEIDWKKLDGLLIHQCTCDEAAGELGISSDTLVKRIQEKDGGIYSGFTDYAQTKKRSGLARLRVTQFQKALEGNTSMLDKLGDVYLGQSKEIETPPPNDAMLATINQLIYENLSLKEQLDAIKRKTDPVLCGSDQEIQHLDRVDESGQNPYIDSEVRPSS